MLSLTQTGCQPEYQNLNSFVAVISRHIRVNCQFTDFNIISDGCTIWLQATELYMIEIFIFTIMFEFWLNGMNLVELVWLNFLQKSILLTIFYFLTHTKVKASVCRKKTSFHLKYLFRGSLIQKTGFSLYVKCHWRCCFYCVDQILAVKVKFAPWCLN